MARKTKKLPVRDQFLILTNGKRSERNYFKCIRGNANSIFKIEVRFMNDSPAALVDFAVSQKKPSNQVYCVFDKDQFSSESIYKAISLARQHGIGIAFSNLAFEVWLIDHFKKCEAEKTIDQLIEIIDDELKRNNYPKGYEKNDAVVFEKVFLPRLEDAIQNAEIVRQKRIAAYRETGRRDENYPVCDWNSYTDVHKLIASLQLQIKSNI